jgi:hypothetical protein
MCFFLESERCFEVKSEEAVCLAWNARQHSFQRPYLGVPLPENKLF